MARMTRIVCKIQILVLFSFFYVLHEVCAQQNKMEDSKLGAPLDSDSTKKLSVSKRGASPGMWFGPRLGKRALQGRQDLQASPDGLTWSRGTSAIVGSDGHEDVLRKLFLLEENELAEPGDMENIGEMAELGGNGCPISAGSKRRFTPRLGRDSSEHDGGAAGSSRTADFIPRLGRELLRNLLMPRTGSSVYARGTGDERAPALSDTRAPPFAPRLGRELPLQLQPLADVYALDLAMRDRSSRVTRSTNEKQKTLKSDPGCALMQKTSKAT